MKHSENEIQLLKYEVKDMWQLVILQVKKAQNSILNNDCNTALEILENEKKVNTFELKIVEQCENYIALYSPVAIDLRLTLSLIRISNELERISDFTTSIANFILKKEFKKNCAYILNKLKVESIFDILISMLLDGYVAFDTEQTKAASKIILKDEKVDEIFHNAFDTLTLHISQYPEDTRFVLKILLILKNLERLGDHHNNIVEEIVFFVDAKVLKHIGKTSS